MRPHMKRVALTVAVSLLALGTACTSEQESSPRPTLTSTTSTSTTTPPATTAATSTTTSTAAPTTVGATTTTLPSGPADVLVPLLIGGADSAGWLFLGAWQRDSWQESIDPSGDPIRPGIAAGTPFTVSNLEGETDVELGENTEACFDDQVGPAIDVDVSPPEPPGFGYNAVAMLTQAWPLKPRPVATTATAPDAYQALGEASFDGEPVDATQGDVEQVVVADLDNDGDDEALVAFEFVQPTAAPGAPGDLAAILLVDVDTRNASTVLQSLVPEDLDEDTFPLIERFRVLDVADLNGDGRMEVLIHAWYYEGASVVVYTYDGAELTQVLAAGCGA